jgi:hypothetical protein
MSHHELDGDLLTKAMLAPELLLVLLDNRLIHGHLAVLTHICLILNLYSSNINLNHGRHSVRSRQNRHRVRRTKRPTLWALFASPPGKRKLKIAIAQAIKIPATSSLVYLSGCIGTALDGKIVEGGVEEQTVRHIILEDSSLTVSHSYKCARTYWRSPKPQGRTSHISSNAIVRIYLYELTTISYRNCAVYLKDMNDFGRVNKVYGPSLLLSTLVSVV